MQPTLEMAETWSKDRLATMLRDTPCLRGKVKDPRSRDSGNTILHKRFPAGHLTVCGANSAASLASRPIGRVICDEADRYPASAGTEGDPISLAKKRMASFPDALLVMVSTPTLEKRSRIRKEFLSSDQRFWFCPCPHCGTFQVIEHDQVKWAEDGTSNAWVECKGCSEHIDDEQRQAMVRAGRWVATAKFNGIRGYHLNGLVVLFRQQRGYKNRLHQYVEEFLAAKRGGIESYQVWWNTVNCEVWSADYAVTDTDPLLKRREDYGPALPKKIVVLTAGVDVQNDRLECEVVGWGPGEESWSVEYKVFPGNVAEAEVWQQLDEFLLRTWKAEDGYSMSIACTAIDFGNGNHSKYICDFCRPRAARRVYAVKGRGGPGIHLVSTPKPNKKYKVMHYIIGADTAKGIIYGRLKIEKPGPGYMHFPKRKEYESEYFKQLTSEQPDYKVRGGHYVLVWLQKYTRNEALDCRNYALGALAILNPDFTVLTKRLERTRRVYNLKAATKPTEQTEKAPEVSTVQTEKPAETEQKQEAQPRKIVRRSRRPGGFVNAWKKY